MNELYPFRSHYFSCNGLRMHYVDEGRGEPVVMVHGNPTWSFFYRNLILGLRDQYRVLAPDHIGCGLSDKPGTDTYPYRLKHRIDDLESWLEFVGLNSSINLVVHDWGGMIGMGYAVRHPERIRRLVILNTAAFHLPESKTFPWPLWLGRNTRLGAFLILRLNAFCRTAVSVCCKKTPMPSLVKKGYLMPYDSAAARIAVLRFVQDIPLRPGDASYGLVSEIENGLHRLADKPMLICWGDRDFVFDHHFLTEWERRFPHAEVHRFPDAGHYVLEDEGEAVLEKVRSFLGREK